MSELLLHNPDSVYGADADEWLRRWDAGQSVHTIEMGGLGPGYEQCIQITTAELLRLMIAGKYDYLKWNTGEQWGEDRKAIDDAAREVQAIKELGLSGAQFGAAMSLASALYMRGPVSVMTEKATRSRHILAQKNFPK